MGRITKPSTEIENNKPQVDNQKPEPNHQSTPLQPLIQVSEPQGQPLAEVYEPPRQEPLQGTAVSGQPQPYIQPLQIYIQPQIQVPQGSYVQQNPPPMAPSYQTYGAQGFTPQQPPQPPVSCPPQAAYPQYRQGWSTGLFDCMDDPENALITLCCPCVTFGQIAEIIDNGRTTCETAGCIYTMIALIIAFPCIYSFSYRTKLRGRFRLDETPAPDCITHLCCEYCALCQEYRELNHRGLNPSAGWMNVNNQNMHQQQGMVPPGYQTMR